MGVDTDRISAITERIKALFQRVMAVEDAQERFTLANEGLREIIQQMGVTSQELVATGLSIKVDGQEVVQIDESTAEKIYAAVKQGIAQNRLFTEFLGKDGENHGE